MVDWLDGGTSIAGPEEPRQVGESTVMDKDKSAPSRVVLVADDDTGLRVMIRTALEQDGWTVEEAQNGQAACVEFERVHPDIVLLDVSMPVLDGFDACAKLRTLRVAPISLC